MSAFGRRLARVAPPPAAPAEPRADARNRASAAPGAVLPQASATVTSNTLEALRQRLDSALGAGHAQQLPSAARELPVARELRAEGPLWVRRTAVAADAQVGAMQLAGAKDARADLLALLALDPALAGCPPSRALYIDTETTGLSGGTGTVPFVVGLAFATAEGFQVEQYFLHNLGEEAAMLAALAERIAAASMLISFNGKSFDLPLLRTRFALHRMALPKEPPHLDLVHVARRVHRDPFAASRRSFRLVDLESSLLAYVRIGDIAGADIPAAYMHYLRSGDTATMAAVIEHNHWDLLAMVALVALYGEPLERTQVDATGLAGMARTYQRASAPALARAHSEAAVLRGGGAAALDARARIHKAQADLNAALADFATLAASVDSPRVRLELAKLYEHHARDFLRAAALAEVGTGESAASAAKRKQRLARKQAGAGQQPALPSTESPQLQSGARVHEVRRRR